MDEKTPWWKSKTVLTNIALAAATQVPGVSEFVSQNPDAVVAGASMVNLALRAVTKGKISLPFGK